MKTSRNSQCPCSSGKKFKKCCGNPAILLEKDREILKRIQIEAKLKRIEEEKVYPKSQFNSRSPLAAAMLLASELSVGSFSRR